MKFNPKTHIVGKVYDLTQENMNAMIAAFESGFAQGRQSAIDDLRSDMAEQRFDHHLAMGNMQMSEITSWLEGK